MNTSKISSIKIRLSPKEKENLSAAAKEANMNMSQFILSRTLHDPISSTYYTKTTHDFILRLEQLRYQIREFNKNQTLDEMLRLIDKELLYLW